MTTEELQEILTSKEKISLERYKQILFELRNYCFDMRNTPRTNQRNFYSGEMNAFQIALDLAKQIER